MLFQTSVMDLWSHCRVSSAEWDIHTVGDLCLKTLMVDVTQGFKVENEKEITLCIFKGLQWKEFCLRFTNQTKAPWMSVRWMCPLTLRGLEYFPKLHFEALISVGQTDLHLSHHLVHSYVFRWSYLSKNTKRKANKQKKKILWNRCDFFFS